MTTANDKSVQLAIRLDPHIVEQVDERRGRTPRTTFARDLLVSAIAGGKSSAVNIAPIMEAIESLRHDLAEVRQALVLLQRDTGKQESRLRQDLATAIVGVLTKIGQVVREEDQRKFAREKAETFAKRVLFGKDYHAEEEEQ